MSSVTTILVTYNSASVVKAALRALVAEPLVARIIVVDNASSDDTVALIAQAFPAVERIVNAKNIGFGRANNIALEQVNTPYALLVNPDAVMGQGAVSLLVAAAKNYPDAAIFAPQIVDEQGRAVLNYKDNVFKREKARRKMPIAQADVEAEYLSGAVMLLNMAHMRKVGFFDHAIFLFYEDDDLCLRSNAAGFRNMVIPAAKATHLQGASSGAVNFESEYFKQKHMVASRIYLEHKYHGSAASCWLSYKLRLIYGVKTAFFALTLNKPKFTRYRGRLAGLVLR